MTKMNNLCKAALTLGFALLAATAATAQTMGTASTDLWDTNFQKAFMTEKMMHMMDMSHKGMVTKADYDKYMGQVFDMMDKKHKGMLAKDDFLAMDAGSTTIWTTDFQPSPMPGHTPNPVPPDFRKSLDPNDRYLRVPFGFRLVARLVPAPIHHPGATRLELDDEDPAFDELDAPGAPHYRRAVGE